MKGKKIFFFAPSFFGYYKKIEEVLINKGCIVDTILEDFSDSSYLYRFFYSKNKRAKTKYTKKYYDSFLSNISSDYDYIFVIRGEALSKEYLMKIKDKNQNAIFIMYQWDSIRNNPNTLLIEDVFDYNITFDMNDANQYGWLYRPLFYIEDDHLDNLSKSIDFAFVGTLYYKRALLLHKIQEFCKGHNKILYDYLYSPKLVYYLHKYVLKDSRYSIVKKDNVKFKSLSNKDVNHIYRKSKILVDYAADDQAGLTMRTIESIGYNCKVVTNNKNIMKTDIYKYGNIYVYDIDNFMIPESFINEPYHNLPNELLYYYSLNGWVDSIFSYMELRK